jgi:hypothetical protein
MDFNDSSVDLSTIRAVAVSIASAEQREREVIRREDLERAFSDGKVYWQKEDLTRKTKPLAFPPLPYNGTVQQSNDVVDEPCEDGRDSSDRTRIPPQEYASSSSRRSSLSSQRKRMSEELLLSSETLHFSEQDRRSAALLFDLIMEIEDIENKRRSRRITNEALQELITNVCCKLDGTDTNGSEGLRCMRKSIINMAVAVAQRSEEMEDKYNNNKKSTTTNNTPSSEKVESSQPRKKLTLPGYSLGDILSNNQHMVTPSSLKDGIEYASTLQPLDFAFILRSNGTWTYAVVCDILNCNNNKPSIKFVVDRQGCTRTIPKKYWGKYICLINEDHAKQVMNTDATSAVASGGAIHKSNTASMA